MTGFGDLVPAGGTLAGLTVTDKTALLAALADRAGELTGQAGALVLERVRERETLGSTGFGQGGAIPHARIPGLAQVVAVVARLAQPVDYGSLDGEPVDVAVLLLSPEGAGADHLKALARVSRALRDPGFLAAVRASGDDSALRAVVDSPPAPAKAA